MGLQSRYLLRLVSSEGLTGAGHPLARRLTTWLVMAVSCWLKAFILLHMSHSTVLLCVPMTQEMTTPRVGNPRDQGRTANVIYDLLLKVTPSPLHTLLVTQTSSESMREGMTQEKKYSVAKAIGGHLGSWLSHHLAVLQTYRAYGQLRALYLLLVPSQWKGIFPEVCAKFAPSCYSINHSV